MAELADRHIDYAFFCCDGVYNMDAAEASRCAEAVQAVHSIPYHTAPAEQGFSQTAADQFQADGKLILKPGEELELVTN